MTQAHIFYSGRVQGVGFRFTVQRYAMDLNLKGWVKNLPDGRVEVVMEGPKEVIQEYCQEIKNYFDDYIRDIKIHYRDSEKKFKEFFEII